tara:strand:- start:672 stop:1313 length:642 start_codon:yes stop_codon:yes gene_type:complete
MSALIDSYVKEFSIGDSGNYLTLEEIKSLLKYVLTIPITEYNDYSGKTHLVKEPKFIFYGRPVSQRRNVGFLVKDPEKIKGYKYSNQMMPSQKLPDFLLDFLNRYNDNYGTNHNSILINQYMNGDHYISAHSDDEKDLVRSASVDSLTLCEKDAVRTITFKDKKTKRTVKKVVLYPGMIVRMLPGCQSRYTHQINKQRNKGMRISFTMREFRI